MKKVNNLTINVKFPFISKEKKEYISFLRKNNTKKGYFQNKENLKIKTINPIKSVNLFQTFTPNYQKNYLLKSFSSSNLYITKLPSEEKSKLKNNNNYYETFALQIIPPHKKKKIFRMKAKGKKVRYKELKYIGVLLGLAEKKEKKSDKRKNIIPIESRKDYFNFIRHKRNLFFNPNATSNFVHEKSSNFLISSIVKSKSYSVLNNKIKIKDQKEELLELRDKVPFAAFDLEKMIKQIKSLFSEDFKFNNMQFNEDFYKNFENRINFMEDIYRVPIIKNNLVKIKIDNEKTLGVNEWKNINVINSQTLNFLNQLKRKIQREKDEKARKLEEYLIKKREAEKEYEILEKKNKGKIEEKKDEKEKEKEAEKLKNIMADIIDKEEKKEQKFEDLYDIEEYFLHKNNYFDDSVSVAPDKLRTFFFDNQ